VRRAQWALAAACVAGLAACGQDLGEPGVWTPVGDVSGMLAAEIGPLPARAPAPAGRTTQNPVRVVSYNVERGGDVDGLARVLRDDPELAVAGIILVQEEEWHPAEGTSRASRLAAALGLGYVYIPAREYHGGTHGLAIMSAFPIENVELMRLAPSDKGNPRIAVRADIRIGDRTLRIINVHLDTVLNVRDRILQLRPAVIDAPDTVIVAGDFNTNPYLWEEGQVPVLPAASIADTDQAPILDDYMRSLDFDTPTAELGPTETMFGIESRLDSIYTRGLGVTPGKVVRSSSVSDHWPLWVDVTLP
jgi:endonuclease/exonuclease/phosphatase family metal-dependent hydrolase